MALPVRLGISLPVPPDVDTTLKTAEWAEAQGFDGVWFADSGDADPMTLSAAVAVKTKRVRIGVVVVPAYTRTPVVFGSTLLALSHLAPNRFILGLGASSHLMVEGWHGMPLHKPLTRVKETVQILRAIQSGEKVDFDGDVLHSHGYRLTQPMKSKVPIYIGALRQNMLEMAGEFGDGVVVNLFPAPTLPKLMEHIAVGAAKAGKSVADLDIVCRFQVAVTDDAPAARERFRQRFAPYYATPVYNRFLAWTGYDAVADTIAAGWKAKDRARTTGALNDALVDELAVIGTAEECRAKVAAMCKAGITTPVIHPLLTEPDALRRTFEAFTPANFKAA
jgi:probable F420-dependent oxidoreductase